MTSVSAANSMWTKTISTLALVGLLLYLDQLFHALLSLSPETNYPDYKPNNENADGKGEETNVIDEADRRDVDKPDVYFESNANEAEEVRLNGPSSSGLNGGEADGKNSKKTKNRDEVGQTSKTRANSKKQKNATSSSKKEVEARKSTDGKNSKLDASHSLTNNRSREVKERESKGKKKSKRVMSSPWILILAILACIILAVLRGFQNTESHFTTLAQN